LLIVKELVKDHRSRFGQIIFAAEIKLWKIHRANFSIAGNSYPAFHPAALLNPLFSLSREWHRGCYYTYQTKWRASGRFRMDLTARDPSKVPRCILSRFAGVSEASAERETAGEILSEAKDLLRIIR
jgi:hypothetical protein